MKKKRPKKKKRPSLVEQRLEEYCQRLEKGMDQIELDPEGVIEGRRMLQERLSVTYLTSSLNRNQPEPPEPTLEEFVLEEMLHRKRPSLSDLDLALMFEVSIHSVRKAIKQARLAKAALKQVS